jgi:hypothetical protein
MDLVDELEDVDVSTIVPAARGCRLCMSGQDISVADERAPKA